MFNAISFTGISKFQGYKKTSPVEKQQHTNKSSSSGDKVTFTSKLNQVSDFDGEVGYRKNNVGIIAEKYIDEMDAVVKKLSDPTLTSAQKDTLEKHLRNLALAVEQLSTEIL